MEWFSLKFENDQLILIDQRILPEHVEYVPCKVYEDVVFAISDMIVRGAPAIGISGAYGYYLGFLQGADMEVCKKALIDSRPTAVNLEWAVMRMDQVYQGVKHLSREEIRKSLEKEAVSIHEEDIQMNYDMATFGVEVIPDGAQVLTHCNTGALATSTHGTALGVIRSAFKEGKVKHIYADETRPRLQGARLTAFEIVSDKLPGTLIPDSAAAVLMSKGKIDVVLVGADRITQNGDTANKIGTFNVSILAKNFGIPFYIVAPTSTIDFEMKTGADIVIEEREKEEVTMVNGTYIAPRDVDVFNPAFDVTPHGNITGIVTEKGVIYPPFKDNILKIKKEMEVK